MDRRQADGPLELVRHRCNEARLTQRYAVTGLCAYTLASIVARHALGIELWPWPLVLLVILLIVVVAAVKQAISYEVALRLLDAIEREYFATGFWPSTAEILSHDTGAGSIQDTASGLKILLTFGVVERDGLGPHSRIMLSPAHLAVAPPIRFPQERIR